MKLLLSACFLLLLLVINGNKAVECRRHPHPRKQDRMLFVFGDSFVDAGNRPPTADRTVRSREWFYPYGSSDYSHHQNATGRFSDGLVQSDLFARILGLDESPPPYRLRQADEVDPSGVNFAMGGSGGLMGSEEPSLTNQIDQFRRLVRHGIVDEEDLDNSVALIAFNGGRDYESITVTSTSDDIRALSGKVTDEIVHCVERLQELGVSSVVVNTLPPIGCQPFRASIYNYAQCDSLGNTVSDVHNDALTHKLGASQDVLVLDVHAAFLDVVQSRYAPCCAGVGDGYCGEEDHDGKPLYNLCPDPENFFYWDHMHPTQAAWESIMDRLREPIQGFLSI